MIVIMMMMAMVPIIVRGGGLHDDMTMQRVFSVILSFCRSGGPERPSGQPAHLGGERPDLVYRRKPDKRPSGKVRHWESFEATISIRITRGGRRSE